MGARLKFWRRSRVPKKGSRDEAVEILKLTEWKSKLKDKGFMKMFDWELSRYISKLTFQSKSNRLVLNM